MHTNGVSYTGQRAGSTRWHRRVRLWVWWCVVGLACQVSLSGCGRKGAPQPLRPQAPSAQTMVQGAERALGA